MVLLGASDTLFTRLLSGIHLDLSSTHASTNIEVISWCVFHPPSMYLYTHMIIGGIFIYALQSSWRPWSDSAWREQSSHPSRRDNEGTAVYDNAEQKPPTWYPSAGLGCCGSRLQCPLQLHQQNLQVLFSSWKYEFRCKLLYVKLYIFTLVIHGHAGDEASCTGFHRTTWLQKLLQGEYSQIAQPRAH